VQEANKASTLATEGARQGEPPIPTAANQSAVPTIAAADSDAAVARVVRAMALSSARPPPVP
jgi:hypothetical protein